MDRYGRLRVRKARRRCCKEALMSSDPMPRNKPWINIGLNPKCTATETPKKRHRTWKVLTFTQLSVSLKMIGLAYDPFYNGMDCIYILRKGVFYNVHTLHQEE